MVVQQRKQVLVFNPNTSTAINDSLVPILSKLNLPDIDYSYWTCPTGLCIIKTQQDMYESTSQCLPLLLKIADKFDGFLGACYADHPLVRLFQSYVGDKPVVGIFDASITAALHVTGSDATFGIVTTGKPFESLLSEGVVRLLGGTGSSMHTQAHKFSGVAASGIGTDDLQPEHRDMAREKIHNATTTLLTRHDIETICIGGVILIGMEAWIREACEAIMGPEKGRTVKIIDQVSAGALVLNAMLRRDTYIDFEAALL